MIKIKVNASKPYDVILKAGVLSEAGRLIQEDLQQRRGTAGMLRCRRICVIMDEMVDALYGGSDQALMTSLKQSGFETTKFVFPGGEDLKVIGTVEEILEHLSQHLFTRSDLLIALGGGIPGDVTGFAAAVYMRGIDFIQIPTTLLSAVDSSVGGKTGVNLVSGKNLAGAFWQPNMVLFDPVVLTTLSLPLLLDGLAEILKAGFIADKTVIYDALMAPYEAEPEAEDSPTARDDLSKYACLRVGAGSGRPPIFDDPQAMIRLIAKAIDIKREIVEEDEWETGRRKLLNLGHTIAHAIEKQSGYKVSHGSAVAMGTAIIASAADRLGWTEPGYSEDIRSILTYFGYDLRCPYTARELAEAARNDKKSHGTQITLVIPDYPGHCRLMDVSSDELEGIIEKGL